MRDILRLGRYLKPYSGRIVMAVVASFLSAACLYAFLSLSKTIFQETFSPGHASSRAEAAPTGSPGGPAKSEVREGGGAAAVEPPGGSRPKDPGAKTSTVPSAGDDVIARAQGWRESAQKGLEHAIGLDRLRAYLQAAPFTRVPLAIIFIFFLKGIFTYFAEYWLKWVGYRTIQDLRLDVFEKVLGQSTRFFSTYPTGVLMSRVMSDVGRLQKIASSNLADAVRLTFTIVFMVAGVFIISWRLSVVCLIGMPLVLIPLVKFGRRLKAASRSSQEKAAEVSNVLNEVITGNRIVKAFGMEAFELSRFRAALIRMFRFDAKALRTVALTSPVLELTGATLGAGVFWYAGHVIGQGRLDGANFLAFLLGLGYLFVSLKSMSAMNNDLQQAIAAAARVFEMMDMSNEIVEATDAIELPRLSDELRLEDVRFRYDNRLVLDGIDLRARAGEVHALVGSSGAGKTTLINLLPRFYDVTDGRVTIDGVDIRRATLASLRGQIALVTQEMILFNDTVRNNIAYGHPSIPLEQVQAAARAAGAHDFILDIPEGYDAVIGEHGVRLSAGQRQRITIARAFLKNAPILILDEATSALDSESESLVQRALEALMKGRTSIVIAHRLSTIRRADCIHVIEGGRIVERGRHDELVARGGPYSRLYEIQFREAEV